MTQEYIPPKIWQNESSNGGEFSNINRPVSGSTHEKKLPEGNNPLQLHSLATPNGIKVTVMLEVLLERGHKDAEYDAFFIDITKGDQFSTGFVELNPNSKIPALIDRSIEPSIRVFESGAILLYLAKKFDELLPNSKHEQTEILNWLFWQMGSAPYLGGGFGHFYAYAPEKIQYPIDRFTMETKRQLDVLDKALENNSFIGSKDLSIADIAIWPWYGSLVLGRLYEAAEFLQVDLYKNVLDWAKRLDELPAFKRGRLVNRIWGDGDKLPNRHSSYDFKSLGL